MTETRKITLNIAANLAVFAITIIISLFVTPIIVEALGGEAYGFVSLAGNFVNYAALATVALNAMAGRFISIEIYRKDFSAANRYFSSVFFANLVIILALIPVFTGVVLWLEHLIEIPEYLVADVKFAFAVTFLQFLINLLFSRYETATFVTNRLYLNQKNTLIAACMRLAITLLTFRFFSVRISIFVSATMLGSLFCNVMNLVYTKRYLPELKISRRFFDFSSIKELLSSGVWSLVSKLSSILLDGLDLLLANLFVGPLEMGALALSRTVTTMFYSLRGTLDYPFAPSMTKCFAQGDTAGLVRTVRMGNKVLGIIMIAPIAVFAIYGSDFFALWVPTEDNMMIQILALLAMVNLLASACINSVFTLFSVTNRVKLPALVTLLTGILTVAINLFLLRFTDLGVYAIAGTASFLGLLRNCIFTPLYGAHCLKVKKGTFYKEIVTGNICLIMNLLICGVFYRFISAGETWGSLIVSCVVTALICAVVNSFIVLSKEDRNIVFNMLKKRLIKG